LIRFEAAEEVHELLRREIVAPSREHSPQAEDLIVLCLEAGFEDSFLATVAPFFQSLRKDPRFAALFARDEQ
jgi:hypothetical protein